MSTSTRLLASSIVVLLCLSAYQTYLNAAECRFYGHTYSWFRGACVVGSKPVRKSGWMSPALPPWMTASAIGPG